MQAGFSDSTIRELLSYTLRGGTGWHITRNFMYKSLGGKLTSHDSSTKACLAISKSRYFGKILGLRQVEYTDADYPDYNILDLNFADAAFDFCVSDQVLEHVEGNPFRAMQESARVIKRGGYVCHTTCLLTEVHKIPTDLWRFTKDGLVLLAKDSGLEVVEVGSWGNREAWALIHAGFRMAKLPEDPEHPLYKLAMRNEPEWPIVTWILARKP